MDSTFLEILKELGGESRYVIDPAIPFSTYTHLDLSSDNASLEHVDLSDPHSVQQYLDAFLLERNAQVAYGGYNEVRNLYKSSTLFKDSSIEERNIHLGLDLWVAAGTAVIAPLEGRIHSFKDNNVIGDYGPTIILEHTVKDVRFYTLYGHLSRASLQNLEIGKTVEKGTMIARLGTPEENVNYAPHLHFQVVFDLEGNVGDYPGVCGTSKRSFYLKNCPDPIILLGMHVN